MINVTYNAEGLCPFGLHSNEPIDIIEGWPMGLREAVWRGYVSLERGKEISPDLDWSVIQ